MSGLMAAVGAGVSSATLLFSGITHLWRLGRFKSQLGRQRVLPPALEWPVVVGIAAAEVALGLGGVLALTGTLGSRSWGDTAFASAAVLFAAYAAYAAYLVRRRPGVPCGCGNGEEAASVWTVSRAALLGLGAGAACLGAADFPAPGPGWQGAVAVLAALALALVVWNIPAALRAPHPLAPASAGNGRTS